MKKPGKIFYRNKTNIFDMMRDRELCFDGDGEESTLKQSSEFKTKQTSYEDEVKQLTRAQLIKYLRVYKANYELLSFILKPKFRPPPQVQPVIEPEKTQPKPRDWFSNANNRADHRIVQTSHTSPSSTAFKLGRNKPVRLQSKHKRWSIPYCYSNCNCRSLPRESRALGIQQRSGNFSGANKELFYDVESFTNI